MNCLIIEDELLAAERLKILLREYDPLIEICDIIESVESSVSWLQKNKAPNFILMDIQLSDGFAFDIFKEVHLTTPIIFTTAFNQYALDAFKVLSIDYLLKPVSGEALAQAIGKLKILQQQSISNYLDYDKLMQVFSGQHSFKSRFMGKIGSKIQIIETKDISFFEADNKLHYVTTFEGSRFLIDQTLEQLESILNPKFFFRINRSMIIQVTAIIQVKPYLNSRLKAILKNGDRPEEIIVSRERVNEFRKWADS